MTVPVFFTANRSSPSVVLAVKGTTQPTLRASGAVIDIPNANNVTISWPAGSVAGDLALIAVSNGYQTNVPAGWTQLVRDNQSNWNTAIFYKVLTSGDITTGSINITFANTYCGCAAIATYQNGSTLSVDLFMYNTTGGGATAYLYPMGAEATRSYFVFGSCRANGAVTFDVATKVSGFNSASGADVHSAGLGLYAPGASASVSEAVRFAASGNGATGAIVRLTAGSSGGNLSASSTAISAASEADRQAIGNLYFETVINAKSGVVSIGVVNFFASFGAASLGATTNSFSYNSDGTVKINGVTLTTISNFTTGDRVSVAYDASNRLAWFKVNAGSWNNDGTADPATKVNGIDVSTYVAGQNYPAVGFSAGGSAVTAAFARADWAYTEPVGFNSIEDDASSVVTFAVAHDQIAFADVLPPDDSGDWFAISETGDVNYSRAVSFPAGPIKLVAGSVQEDGVGVEGKLVRMYNKRTGEYVGETLTNGAGDFSIPAQDPTLPHFVVAFDDPTYNAKVYDNVIPG